LWDAHGTPVEKHWCWGLKKFREKLSNPKNERVGRQAGQTSHPEKIKIIQTKVTITLSLNTFIE
jgi:hypothetical protein